MRKRMLLTSSIRIGFLALVFTMLTGVQASMAQDEILDPKVLVNWTTTAQPSAAHPGQEVRLTISGEIAPGWKMYALDSPPPSRPSRVRVGTLPDGLVQQGEVVQATPEEGYDPNFDANVRYFENRATFRAQFLVNDAMVPGEQKISGVVNFMICNDRLCLPPSDAPFEAAFRFVPANTTTDVREAADLAERPPVTPPVAEPEPHLENQAPPSLVDAAPVPPLTTGAATDSATASMVPSPPAISPTTSSDYNASRTGGIWGFLVLAVGAGLASLLMPCVFPMIPLTVSYFTKHAHSRSAALRMALAYGFAIVFTFVGLGLLMALFVGAAGAQTIAANPWINLFIGLIFIVFALSLLGLFELTLPNGLVNFFNRQGNERGGFIGVLFMGFTLTLVSFSCTAPFVGGLLAATATGAWSYPILGMLVYSATFALPFFLFALFPRGLNALPKSGAWMNTLKVVLGFVELAAAIKFLSNADLVWGWNVISRPLAVAICVVVFFLAGMYLLGKLRLKHESAVEQVGVGRLLPAIGFVGLSLYMLPGLFGASLGGLDAFLPPRQATDIGLLALSATTPIGHDDGWFTDDIDAAFAEAEALGKPVFIDFTGYTCTNCRQMEANIFPRPGVAERFQRDFVLLRLYTDGPEKGEEFQRFQLRLTGTVALPTYAIVSPYERTLILRESGLMPEEDFTAFLDSGRAEFDDRALATTSRR